MKNEDDPFEEILNRTRQHSKNDKNYANFEAAVLDLKDWRDRIDDNMSKELAEQTKAELDDLMRPYACAVAAKESESVDNKGRPKKTFLDKLFGSNS